MARCVAAVAAFFVSMAFDILYTEEEDFGCL